MSGVYPFPLVAGTLPAFPSGEGGPTELVDEEITPSTAQVGFSLSVLAGATGENVTPFWVRTPSVIAESFPLQPLSKPFKERIMCSRVVGGKGVISRLLIHR